MRKSGVQIGISQAVAAARLLQEIEQKKFKPIPDGWFTRQDYEAENECCDTTAINSINKLVRAGRVEVSSWPMLDSRGRTQHKTIYKLKT